MVEVQQSASYNFCFFVFYSRSSTDTMTTLTSNWEVRGKEYRMIGETAHICCMQKIHDITQNQMSQLKL